MEVYSDRFISSGTLFMREENSRVKACDDSYFVGFSLGWLALLSQVAVLGTKGHKGAADWT